MAHPTNRAVSERSAGYDYGPPTVVGEGPEDSGTPQDNSDAVNVLIPGESPTVPPADTVYEPGGSPSDEVLELHDPSIGGLSPATAVVGADATVTVNGGNFRDNSVVEVDGSAVSTTYGTAASLTAVLPDPGTAKTVNVTVRNETSQMESNTVVFTWTAAERQER